MDATANEDGRIAGLLPHHCRELHASGLTEATILAAGIYSEANHYKLSGILNRKSQIRKMVPAIVYPYRAADGSNGYYRVKPDRPVSIGGKPAKYLSPSGRPNEIYIPPSVADLLEKPDAELLITEGEKKALKATQEGFPCIGLVGAFGWKDGKSERLLTALDRIAWTGRPVRIVFDSDIIRKGDVQEGESRFAKHASDRGAKVRVVRLPDGPTSEDGKPAKMGLDDFLVAHGPAALRKLLDSAGEPEPLSEIELKAEANKIEPADEIQAYLSLVEKDGVPTLRFWKGSWLNWRDGCYREVPSEEVRCELILKVNQTYRNLKTGIVANLIDQLKAQAMLRGSVELPAWLGDDPPPWPVDEIIATRSGLIHLPSVASQLKENTTGDFQRPLSPRFFTTNSVDYSFSQGTSEPPEWMKFLKQLWPDDPESISTLREWFGYCLTPDTSQQKLLMLLGPKRSGKGTILRTLRTVLGPSNVCGPSLANLESNFGLWPLVGKSVAIISDMRLSKRTNQAVIVERLLSITGEDAIDVDRKFLEPWTGKLSTRLILVSNELPKLSDSSGALPGRMILLRTIKSFFGEEDPGLTQKLRAEAPGILRWAIAGWSQLRKRERFQQPESGKEMIDDIYCLASPVTQFAGECCEFGPLYSIPIPELFKLWQWWCDRKGMRSGIESMFGRDFRASHAELKVSQRGTGIDRCRWYDGVHIKPEYVF